MSLVRLELEDLKGQLKKLRHATLQRLSKRIVPDDLRTYIVDFSGVLPSYIKPK
jgi:hypothetical protein